MQLNPQYIESFQKITGVDLNRYFLRFIVFTERDYPNIFNFFTGKTATLDREVIQKLNTLTKQVLAIKAIVQIKRDSFNNIAYWDILEAIEDSYIKLLTIGQTSKWTRSSRVNNQFSANVRFEYVLQQNQTLENISFKILSDAFPQTDWQDIALKNDLMEKDYSPDGGNFLNLSKQGPSNLFLESVVDNLTGERLYGIDISQKISFVDEDLQILSPKDTVKQSTNILAKLVSGDIPEFPILGIDSKIVASSRAAIMQASLIRQMSNSFATDDSLLSFQVKNIEIQNDGLFIEYEINTFFDFVYSNTANI